MDGSVIDKIRGMVTTGGITLTEADIVNIRHQDIHQPVVLQEEDLVISQIHIQIISQGVLR